MANYYTNRNGNYLDAERDARTNLQKAEKKCRADLAELRKLVREYLDCIADVPLDVEFNAGHGCVRDVDEELFNKLAKAANYKV